MQIRTRVRWKNKLINLDDLSTLAYIQIAPCECEFQQLYVLSPFSKKLPTSWTPWKLTKISFRWEECKLFGYSISLKQISWIRFLIFLHYILLCKPSHIHFLFHTLQWNLILSLIGVHYSELKAVLSISFSSSPPSNFFGLIIQSLPLLTWLCYKCLPWWLT